MNAQRAILRKGGGSNPQTILYLIERYYPAASVVKVATSPSRRNVICQATRARWTMKEQIERLRIMKRQDL